MPQKIHEYKFSSYCGDPCIKIFTHVYILVRSIIKHKLKDKYIANDFK